MNRNYLSIYRGIAESVVREINDRMLGKLHLVFSWDTQYINTHPLAIAIVTDEQAVVIEMLRSNYEYEYGDDTFELQDMDEWPDDLDKPVVYSFELNDDGGLDPHRHGAVRDVYLVAPWPVKAFLAAYSYVVEQANAALGWSGGIIVDEKAAE